MKHLTRRGAIRYTSNQPERRGHERGREYFIATEQSDGTLLLHTHSEIDDEPNVVRDVVLSLDREGFPVDCSVRLTVGDRHEGTGLMRFAAGHAECETYNRRDGRISQRIETPERIRWLGSHPIYADALCLRIYDLARGPGREFYPHMMLTSPDHRGATGPMLFKLGFGLEFVGREDIAIALGSFKALHFRYVDSAGQLPVEHPVYDVWCSDDGRYLFLKGEVGGYMQTCYELVELVDGAGRR